MNNLRGFDSWHSITAEPQLNDYDEEDEYLAAHQDRDDWLADKADAEYTHDD